MSDLHERLNSALAAAEPSPAPVEAAMHAGRKIRNRRRAGLLAGAVAVAVAAVAVVGVPAFGHHAALPPAPVSGHILVTVNPPGPHSPAGLIASGLVGSTPWNVSVEAPNSGNCVFEGNGMSLYACAGDQVRPTAAAPIEFEGASGGDADQSFVNFGEVWKGVVSARVELSDGTVLTLHPTTVDGLRFVAFAVPTRLPVDSVTTYTATGEIATAIPFNGNGFRAFGSWLRPGQAPPPRVTGTFGSGTAVTAYLGPWGTCVDLGSGDSDCIPLIKEPGTSALGASGSIVFGSAAESVSYVTITRKDGRTLRAEPTAVGPQRFWAVPLSQPEQVGAHWAAYDRAGKKVASGSVV